MLAIKSNIQSHCLLIFFPFSFWLFLFILSFHLACFLRFFIISLPLCISASLSFYFFVSFSPILIPSLACDISPWLLHCNHHMKSSARSVPFMYKLLLLFPFFNVSALLFSAFGYFLVICNCFAIWNANSQTYFGIIPWNWNFYFFKSEHYIQRK